MADHQEVADQLGRAAERQFEQAQLWAMFVPRVIATMIVWLLLFLLAALPLVLLSNLPAILKWAG